MLRSLRIRLLVMILLAFLPALLFMILSDWERRDLDGRNAQQEAPRLVVFAAGNLQRDVHATQAFLGALTQDPRRRRGDPNLCAEDLRKIQRRANLYSTVGVADSTGQVVCWSTGAFPYPSLARAAWFQETMLHNLLWLGAATMLALLATWFVGHWMVVRPINRLVAATRELASGNLAARTNMDYSGGELGHLARAFDEMAESLEWREAQLRESEQERRHSEVRFTEMVELASDAIIGVDSGFSILFFNRGAQRIFGYSADEVEGRDLRILDPASDYPRNGHSELVNALRDPGSQRVEVMVRAKDGTVFTADTSFTRANRNGQTSYTLILRERKTAETSEVAR